MYQFILRRVYIYNISGTRVPAVCSEQKLEASALPVIRRVDHLIECGWL